MRIDRQGRKQKSPPKSKRGNTRESNSEERFQRREGGREREGREGREGGRERSVVFLSSFFPISFLPHIHIIVTRQL